MQILSWILACVYVVAPAAGLVLAVAQSRRSRTNGPFVALGLTAISAVVLSVTVVWFYARATSSRMPLGQVTLAAYIFMGVLLVLKGFNRLLRAATVGLVAASSGTPRGAPLKSLGAAVAIGMRTILLFAFGLPYIMAICMVYRPKVVDTDSPKKQLGYAFESVQFTASDGVRLDGWWIPAPANRKPVGDAQWGKRTVILCHGLGANKGNQLILARDLIPNGYNVLAFDFRAHGSSGGQVSTFGDLERRDVLGAVRWIQDNRSEQSQKIFGVGVSMGAAALIAAAADPSAEGQAIDAVAVYDTFDDLGAVVDDLSAKYFVPPLSWAISKVALPIASAHAGVDLKHFSPARVVAGIAPRPLLVIHGRGDDVISFERGVSLFDSAAQPKLRLWLGKLNKEQIFIDRENNEADHNGVIFSNDAARAVRIFFDWDRSIL